MPDPPPPQRQPEARSWLDVHWLFAPRLAARLVAGLLAVYVLAFLVFPPPAVTVVDENNYIRQAQLILSGSTTIEIEDPFTGQPTRIRTLNDYPLGTATLLLPFVAVSGRDGAAYLSLLCLVLGVAVTARWLYEAGRSPLWAVLVLAYPATAVMGRVAMSEAPSLALTALGLWLFWRGTRTGAAAFAGAGLVAGFSFAFREANVLVFAAFFLGALCRRDSGAWALVPAGLVGLAFRLVSAGLFFGDPFFAKAPDPFSLSSLPSTLPLYALSLLVFFPGGALAAALYRGERRPELLGTVVLFVLFHLAYSYSALESGLAKRLILGPRYFVPLLPVLAFASAELWPRLAARASPRLRTVTESVLRFGLPAALATLAVGLVALNWGHATWATRHAVLRDAIREHAPAGALVLTNPEATGKYLDYVEARWFVVNRRTIRLEHAKELLARGSFHVVLLDRSDSDFWRRHAFENEEFMDRLRAAGGQTEILLDLRASPTDRLRIWRIARPE